MDNVSTPAEKAQWVLETKKIKEPPAQRLKEIADSEGIDYAYENLPDDRDMSGLLLFFGDKRAILINTCIDNLGHTNFTFAHELGHYFLNHTPNYLPDGERGFKCSDDDIQKSVRPMERDASRFAVELLMPDSMFRLQMAGAVLDFALINGLANTFQVSKHASAFRALDYIRQPHIIILSRGHEITSMKNSPSARRLALISTNAIPTQTAAYEAIAAKQWHQGFIKVDAAKWLRNCPTNMTLYECTRGNAEVAMTILSLC